MGSIKKTSKNIKPAAEVGHSCQLPIDGAQVDRKLHPRNVTGKSTDPCEWRPSEGPHPTD